MGLDHSAQNVNVCKLVVNHAHISERLTQTGMYMAAKTLKYCSMDFLHVQVSTEYRLQTTTVMYKKAISRQTVNYKLKTH